MNYALSVLDLNYFNSKFTFQILRRPFFTGDSEIDQIFRIFRAMGTANEENWPGCTQLLDYKTSFPKWDPTPLPAAIVAHKADDLFLVSKLQSMGLLS